MVWTYGCSLHTLVRIRSECLARESSGTESRRLGVEAYRDGFLKHVRQNSDEGLASGEAAVHPDNIRFRKLRGLR